MKVPIAEKWGMERGETFLLVSAIMGSDSNASIHDLTYGGKYVRCVTCDRAAYVSMYARPAYGRVATITAQSATRYVFTEPGRVLGSNACPLRPGACDLVSYVRN